MSKRALLIVFSFLCFCEANAQYRPQYVASLGGVFSGPISLTDFRRKAGLTVERFIAGNHWENIRVDSFKVLVVRSGQALTLHLNIGAGFNDSLLGLRKDVQSGDRVLIFDVRATDVSNKGVFLPPLEYKVL